jgi:hypothetical protein
MTRTMREGAEMARGSLADGSARRKLEELVAATRAAAGER